MLRTFRLLKDAPTAFKGVLVQQEPVTGRYFTITPDLSKHDEGVVSELPAHLVEKQPEWFEEVFKLEPEYASKEQVQQWKSLQKLTSTGKKRGRPVGTKNRKYNLSPEGLKSLQEAGRRNGKKRKGSK